MAAHIAVSDVSKYFKRFRKDAGIAGSLKSLVRREFETIKAVDGISFEIENGECVGFIGPNGAGKTTTLKCLTGLLYPTSGTVSVLGYTPFERKPEFLRRISLVMGRKNQLWWDLPASDSFLLNKEIYDISDRAYKKSMDELTDMLDLEDVLDVQVRKLSLGQRMRCELAAALLHAPEVVFLDEPTIGLDVTVQKKLRDFFRHYNEKHGTTILLTSHNMDDVSQLCERVIIIDAGKIVFDGALKKIVREYVRHKHISLVFHTEVKRDDIGKYGEIVECDATSATISVPRPDVPKVSAEMLRSFPVDDLDIKEIELDEVVRLIFSRVTEKEKR